MISNFKTLIRAPILAAYYGQYSLDDTQYNATWLEAIDTEDLLLATHSDIKVVGCQFGHIGCIGKWKYTKTLYGLCKETNPSKFEELNLKHKMDGPQTHPYKPTSISLLLTYGTLCCAHF